LASQPRDVPHRNRYRKGHRFRDRPGRGEGAWVLGAEPDAPLWGEYQGGVPGAFGRPCFAIKPGSV